MGARLVFERVPRHAATDAFNETCHLLLPIFLAESDELSQCNQPTKDDEYKDLLLSRHGGYAACLRLTSGVPNRAVLMRPQASFISEGPPR